MPEIKPIHLDQGGHNSREAGLCIMEAVAWAAGEKHTDAPACASPVLRRFMMTLNDRLDDERRQLLRPFILRTIGTAGDGRDEERREMCRGWLAERLPDIFERAGLQERAEQLREVLPGSLTDEAVRRVLRDAQSDAWAARSKAYGTLRSKVREELAKRAIDWSKFGTDDEQAVAVVVAAAAAAAVAESSSPTTSAWAPPWSCSIGCCRRSRSGRRRSRTPSCCSRGRRRSRSWRGGEWDAVVNRTGRSRDGRGL